ncbi:MAG: MFS transporter [Pseudomonadaceae bacterium]|jgi:MFS family permease|nr:MFS transporter [Pseudomonadaceae bacterium]
MTALAPDSALEQRNTRVLMAAQALGGASPPIIISLGGLVGQQLSTAPELATLPVSLFNLGLALSTIPAGMLIRRLGHRTAYMLGALLGCLAGLVAALGIFQGHFVLFCTGTAVAGFYAACVQNYRFAASDTAAPDRRGRAISRVMIGGLLAAIIGPQMVVWTREAFTSAPFAGSFLGQAALALLALPVLLILRNPPRRQAIAGADAGASLCRIARRPVFIVAASAGVVSYGLMAFIMTAAPIAMVGQGFSAGDAALGIQWHILAMFGPSFITGRLITRFGKLRITGLGLLLIALSGLIAVSGQQLMNFWGSLIVLGLGWNLGFIGSTALLADAYTPAERSRTQSLNDFLVFGMVALASFSSGGLLTSAGWNTINWLILPLVAAVLVMMLWFGCSPHNPGTGMQAAESP